MAEEQLMDNSNSNPGSLGLSQHRTDNKAAATYTCSSVPVQHNSLRSMCVHLFLGIVKPLPNCEISQQLQN